MLFFFCLMILFSLYPPDVAGQNVAYACEGMQMTLLCSGRTSIDIVSVKYGRFSNTVCPSGDTSSDGITCLTTVENRQIKAICNHRTTCTIIVNSANFVTNPCPDNIYKHAEVSYNCI